MNGLTMSESRNSDWLGKRIATYYPKRLGFRRQSIILGLGFAFGIWCLGHYTFIQSSRLWILASLASMICSAIGTLYIWRGLSRRVHLHQHGFMSESYGESQLVLWSEISDIWQTPTQTGISHRAERLNWTIRIQALDGRKIKLSGFDGIRAVAHRAQDALAERLFVNFQIAFQSGTWLRFGKKLAVSDEGLKVGMKAISWYEISDIVLDDRNGIRIGHCQEGTKWIQIPIGSISNFKLLGRLLNWVKTTQSVSTDDAERQVEENRSIGLFEHHGTAGVENSTRDCDVNELAASGYEWDEIDDVITGNCTVEELLARGPRQRPRVPK